MGKDISVIIVTYNSETYIYDCLDSLFKNNDIDDRLEVIIVDNMSVHVNSMFETIKSRYKNRVTLIKNNKNGGYGQGNNVGINNSSAPIFMIMNPDVRLTAPIFCSVLNAYQDESLAILGLKQLISESSRGISFDIDLGRNIFFQMILRRIANRLDLYNQNYMFFSGACFFMRKSSFESIGMFDENIFMYGEEFDIFCRMKKYIPNAINKYNKRLSYIHLIDHRKETLTRLENMNKSLLYVFAKNDLDPKGFVRRLRFHTYIRIIVNILKRDTYYVNLYKEWYSKLNNNIEWLI